MGVSVSCVRTLSVIDRANETTCRALLDELDGLPPDSPD